MISETEQAEEKPDWVFQNGHKIHISPPDLYRLIHDEDYYKEQTNDN